jgi:hypothetical protein
LRIAECWISKKIFYSQAVIPRTIVDSLLEHGLAEKIAICGIQTVIQTSSRLDSFLYSRGYKNRAIVKKMFEFSPIFYDGIECQLST